ncbi:MAG: hypothetical protein HDR26_02850 [Lachnospiraceae bacterium]|nr:hypothetical protein [Lachnospiraceae bacterium]
MKKLFIKSGIFCTIILAFCFCIIFLSMKEPWKQILARWTDSEAYMDENELLPAFEYVKKQDQTTQLIIGDSICKQMFADLNIYNPQISIQATSAPMMVTGQYILVEEYLKYHPDATDVFLIMHPNPLIRTFDTEWSYQYAISAYVETDTISLLDQNTLDIIREMYGTFFLKKEVVELIQNSPILRKLYLNYVYMNKENYKMESYFELADQYVKKMYDLCEENGVTLHLYPSPVSEYFRQEVSDLAYGYGGTWMSSQYPDYFEQIYYYPNEWTNDLSHFGGEYATRERLNETIKTAYAQTVLLDYLQLEAEREE